MSTSEEEGQRYRIGYALEAKKVKTFILPSLLDHAKQHAIDLVPVDPSIPLIHQPPFHCIIHKLYGQDWSDQLIQFVSKYPNSPIIDPPDRILPLRNRISMLEPLTRIPITVGIPRQVVLEEESGFSFPFPVIAKPLLADGAATSHDLFLVLNRKGLENVLKVKKKALCPTVVQEFVNHGGVVFKVYVVGKHVQCVKRRSLPDISEIHDSSDGILPFSRISNAESNVELTNVEMPPSELVEELAMALRMELGLHLFNFDLIRETNDNNKYFVIDINYFPGYAKMPNYEQVFTDFLLEVVTAKPTTRV